MEKNLKNLDDLFKDGLGDYTETPPPAAWGALEKKLNAIPPRRGRLTDRRLWLMALVGLLLVISVPAVKQLPGLFNTGEKTASNTIVNTNPGGSTNPGNTKSKPSGDQNTNTAPIADNHNNANTDVKEQDQSNQPPTKTVNVNNNNRKANNTTASVTKSTRKTGGRVNNNPIQSEPEETAVQPKNVYSSNLSKPAANDESADNPQEDKTLLAAKPKEENAALKTDKPAEKTNIPVINKPKTPKGKFNLLEAGIKVGYETGFDNEAARKIVISPYLQYNISPKLSIMLQPSIKGAQIDSRRIGIAQSYYKVNDDGYATRHIDSNVILPFSTQKYYIVRDTFYQSHDSIVKSYSIGGTYLEFEIPVLLKYNISKKFAVYAGANVAYSKLTGIKENTYTSEPITKVVAGKGIVKAYGVAPPPINPANSEITYTGTPITDYKGPTYSNPTEGAWRAGYMVGFSYEFSNRLLFDALVQQAKVKPSVQGGYNVNTALSAPYIRITLGYKLLK